MWVRDLKLFGVLLFLVTIFFCFGVYKGVRWSFSAFVEDHCWVNESMRAVNCNIYND